MIGSKVNKLNSAVDDFQRNLSYFKQPVKVILRRQRCIKETHLIIGKYQQAFVLWLNFICGPIL